MGGVEGTGGKPEKVGWGEVAEVPVYGAKWL